MEAAYENELFVSCIDFASGTYFSKGDPGPCIQSNYYFRKRVRKMSIQLPDNVETIGDSQGDLTELTHLYISHCKHLKSLPDTITRLHKLEELSVTYCEEFECSENLDQLVSLRHLSLSVRTIKSIPYCLFKLSNLEMLDLRGMIDPLTEFPENLDQLINLRSLFLWDCELKSLPDSISKLSNLETLHLNSSSFLRPLPKFFNLLNLKLCNCIINSLPTSLYCLEIDACPYFEEAIDFDILDYLEQHLNQLANLNTLSISFRSNFLPYIPRLPNLRELILIGCFNLQELPTNLHEFVELCTLSISSSKIKSLPCSITKLYNLRELVLKNCFNLEELPTNLEELVKLSTLNISATKIKSLPCCITKLPNLLRLSLPECFRLETLPNNIYESIFLIGKNLSRRLQRRQWECIGFHRGN